MTKRATMARNAYPLLDVQASSEMLTIEARFYETRDDCLDEATSMNPPKTFLLSS